MDGAAEALEGALASRGAEVVVGASEGLDEAVAFEPDVVVMGVDAIDDKTETIPAAFSRAVPRARVLLLAGSVEQHEIERALKAGAVGLLARDTPVEALARTAFGVSRGEAAVPRWMQSALLDLFRETLPTVLQHPDSDARARRDSGTDHLRRIAAPRPAR
jgi:two-component system response regulator DesR